MESPLSQPIKADHKAAPDRPRKVSLNRTLRRKVVIRQTTLEDLRWFYGGYVKGAFKEHFPDGLNAQGFIAAVNEISDRAIKTVEISDGNNKRPLGVITERIEHGMVEAHVVWMPWTTARNRIEGAIRYINDIRKVPNIWGGKPDRLIALFAVEGEDKVLMTHICRYGILRRVGTLEDAAGPGRPYALFQTKRGI